MKYLSLAIALLELALTIVEILGPELEKHRDGAKAIKYAPSAEKLLKHLRQYGIRRHEYDLVEQERMTRAAREAAVAAGETDQAALASMRSDSK